MTQRDGRRPANNSVMGIIPLGTPLPRLACCPRRLERRLRGFPRRCQPGQRVVRHRDAVDRPAPCFAAADGDGAVYASNLFAALVQDLKVLAPVAIAPTDAPQCETWGRRRGGHRLFALAERLCRVPPFTR
jgi:hypothetical protein